MTPDMQWRDDDDTTDYGPRVSAHPVAEGLLIVLLFVPIVWVVLAVAETFR